MITSIHPVRFAAAILAGALALGAQAPSASAAQAPSASVAQTPSAFDAGCSIVLPLDTLKSVTHTSGLGGATLEFGYNTHVGSSTVPCRLSLSVNDLPGKEADYVKNSLLGFQAAADVFAPLEGTRLSFVAGLSLNAWRWDYQDASRHDQTSMKGAKFGARFGFDYRASNRVNLSLMLQMVELGTDALATRGYNPSWLQVGARYRF